MQQHRAATILSTMNLTGNLRTNFVTCPICGQAMSKSYGNIKGHLNSHIVKGQLSKGLGVIHHIANYLSNKKGCNAAIDRIEDEERKSFIQHFCKVTKEIQGTHFIPQPDLIKPKQGNWW